MFCILSYSFKFQHQLLNFRLNIWSLHFVFPMTQQWGSLTVMASLKSWEDAWHCKCSSNRNLPNWFYSRFLSPILRSLPISNEWFLIVIYNYNHLFLISYFKQQFLDLLHPLMKSNKEAKNTIAMEHLQVKLKQVKLIFYYLLSFYILISLQLKNLYSLSLSLLNNEGDGHNG